MKPAGGAIVEVVVIVVVCASSDETLVVVWTKTSLKVFVSAAYQLASRMTTDESR